jgi:hypothetical protein
MWKSMDLKSLLIGGLLVLLAMCAMGGWPVDPDNVLVSSEMHGRFAIVAQDNDAVVLDTATGETWSQAGMKREQFYAPKIILREPNDFDL